MTTMAAAHYERPWQKIAADLRASLEAKRWLPGDRLPTIDQLADRYSVAPNTVKNALAQLREEGLVSRRGLYVLDQAADGPAE